MTHATRTNCVFPISDFVYVKDQMLNWAQQFNIFCLLDNHQYHIYPNTQECLLGAGTKFYLKANTGNALSQLQDFLEGKPRWLFGHLGYDLKNEIEKLSSYHIDNIQFADLFFFEPEIVIRLNKKEMIIEGSNDVEKIFHSIVSSKFHDFFSTSSILISPRVKKQEYLHIIDQLRRHILKGDCYEINYCQEFFAENTNINPAWIYKKLSSFSPNPFSALYKVKDKFLVCASPERFLYKKGSKIISQPIKGTIKRIFSDKKKDDFSKAELFKSEKDRSENVMVVDVVRNDLSKVCEEGSVRVEELFGIYSFPQVHQMISTVSGELKQSVSFSDIIRATFPMGSMTGAPKKRVMELIEQYEKTKRGIFSGAVGYMDPKGNFDFNVVIRSLLYNATNKYLSFQTGSGITYNSNGEGEWQECMLKAEAIRMALGNS